VKFVSTRGGAAPVSFSDAVLAGLAADGGLFVPRELPRLDARSLEDAVADLPGLAERVLGPFLAGDRLAGELPRLCRAAFDFPLVLDELRDRTALLELFHGPTAAFKDFGARFLAECLTARPDADGRALTVLVATSGDTGGAVAAAFWRRPGTRVAVLYPLGGVSARQEQQLTCWGDNVRSFAVRGTFDDCQRVVKAAFRDERMRREHRLTSANSINVGRLLPQMAYYCWASLAVRARFGAEAGFVIPTGNAGNAVGAFWAKRMGLPLGRIALAANANRVIPDWFEEGEWRPRPSIPTLANAMDVGDPSNMERLFHLYPEREALLADACAASFDDAAIRDVIARGPMEWGRVFCPHTATAVRLREQLGPGPWVVVATAHPAKFETIVEPLVGRTVEPPPSLAALLERPRRVAEIDPSVEALRLGLTE
jgi:threonine synthase